jgi:hypothetical protein
MLSTTDIRWGVVRLGYLGRDVVAFDVVREAFPEVIGPQSVALEPVTVGAEPSPGLCVADLSRDGVMSISDALNTPSRANALAAQSSSLALMFDTSDRRPPCSSSY